MDYRDAMERDVAGVREALTRLAMTREPTLALLDRALDRATNTSAPDSAIFRDLLAQLAGHIRAFDHQLTSLSAELGTGAARELE